MKITIYNDFSLTKEITAECHDSFIKPVQPVLLSKQRFLFNQSGARQKEIMTRIFRRLTPVTCFTFEF